MAMTGMVEITAGHLQQRDLADVQIVRAAAAVAVVGKFAVFDFQRGCIVAGSEYAVFTVPEGTAPDQQVAAFEADAGAIAVRYPRADEIDVFHGRSEEHTSELQSRQYL